MAGIKTEKITLPNEFQLEIAPGWYLEIDIEGFPIKYTLTHGKKSMTFLSNVTKDLCSRNYALRLAKGRRQMILPPHILQAFVDFETFLSWYDPSITEKITE